MRGLLRKFPYSERLRPVWTAGISWAALMLRASATGLVLTSGGIGLAILLDLPPGPLIGVLCVLLLLSKTLIPATKN